MSTASNNLNFEKLIAEARLADEAGVFGRTQVDVSALMANDRPAPSRLIRFYERAMVALPLAACLGIVIGIASLNDGPMGQAPIASAPVSVLDGIANGNLCSIEVIAECAAGPGIAVSADCGCADLDRDGDVDLLDLGSYQRLASAAR